MPRRSRRQRLPTLGAVSFRFSRILPIRPHRRPHGGSTGRLRAAAGVATASRSLRPRHLVKVEYSVHMPSIWLAASRLAARTLMPPMAAFDARSRARDHIARLSLQIADDARFTADGHLYRSKRARLPRHVYNIFGQKTFTIPRCVTLRPRSIRRPLSRRPRFAGTEKRSI